jgi:hypothetical protein
LTLLILSPTFTENRVFSHPELHILSLERNRIGKRFTQHSCCKKTLGERRRSMDGEEKKLTEMEFVERAIKRLRTPPYKGIHSVYSGFNRAFKDYFDVNPVEATTRLTAEGKIVTRPVRGGVMIYLPEDAPASRESKNVLSKILQDSEPEKEG